MTFVSNLVVVSFFFFFRELDWVNRPDWMEKSKVCSLRLADKVVEPGMLLNGITEEDDSPAADADSVPQ